MIASLRALGEVLRRLPVRPTAVTDLLRDQTAALALRDLVRDLFPDAEAAILAARSDGMSREQARVWTFLRHVEQHLFPVYELDEYEQVLCGIPFIRHGWSLDRFHDLDLAPGELLLFALCAQPFAAGFDSRVPLLDAAAAHVPRQLVAEIPADGFTPAELHAQLDDTPYAATAAFADWLWGATGTAFLDLDDEVEVSDADWTRETVALLAAQWEQARAILDRIDALARWLEDDPLTHFSRLLDAALGRDPHQEYLRMRRLHVCEITEAGIVPISRDEPNAIALPVVGAP
ncbi:MAG: hypothetical protein AB7R89_01260 [Dehalococcoidia bacterium]